MKQNKLKVVFMDIETSPNTGYTWEKYEQNVLEFTKGWELLSFAYKVQGENQVHCLARCDFKDKTELSLVKALWEMMNEADVLIGHNGDAFDIKKSKAKFIQHGLPVVSPSISIDTKKVAKAQFKFTSNSLNDLGQTLGLGKKLKTGGFDLWLGCMANDKKSWTTMKAYNKQDIVLLEKVYDKLKVWDTKHTNLAAMQGLTSVCPLCSSPKLQNRGFHFTRASKRQRLQCQECGHWSLGTITRLK